jgi:hypothetical protein
VQGGHHAEVAHCVRAALLELKQGLREADLVTLKPGERLLQQSSWVLLKGTLSTTGLTSAVPAGVPGLPPPPSPGLQAPQSAALRSHSLLQNPQDVTFAGRLNLWV